MENVRNHWKWVVLMLLFVVWWAGCSDNGSSTTRSNEPNDFDSTPLWEMDQRKKDLMRLLPKETYEKITKKAKECDCREKNWRELGLPDKQNWEWYYTYENLIAGMATWEEFAGEGDENTRKLEIAAFLANIAQETGTHATGDAFGGPGCAIQEGYGAAWGSKAYNSYNGCVKQGTCAEAGYCGRGPHQLSWDYNYKAFGKAMGVGDVYLNDPDLLTQDPEIGIAGSIWFWGHAELGEGEDKAKPFKPSAHNVIVGKWKPTENDITCGRKAPSLGVITNIINGGIECVKRTYTTEELAKQCCMKGYICVWTDPQTGVCGAWECRCCKTIDCISSDCQKPTNQATNRVDFFTAIAEAMGVTIPEGFLDDCSKQLNFAQCLSYPDPTKRCGPNTWTEANKMCGPCCITDADCPDDYPTCWGGLDKTVSGGETCSCGN